ncbi:MAG: hypothetical protein AAF609_19635 [Cyanobacteria bacterium P01_C01_bin.120]
MARATVEGAWFWEDAGYGDRSRLHVQSLNEISVMIKKLVRHVSFATLLSGLFGAFLAVQAAPDPLFEPILEDIQAELPEGWQFRLPTAVPSDSALYPFISTATDTQLIVSLGVTPDCHAADCTIGMIGATSEAASDWPPEGQNLTPVGLGEGIEGYHLIRGEGDAANQLVMWQQDGLVYAIATLASAPSQAEFVAIARSMASEPPILP